MDFMHGKGFAMFRLTAVVLGIVSLTGCAWVQRYCAFEGNNYSGSEVQIVANSEKDTTTIFISGFTYDPSNIQSRKELSRRLENITHQLGRVESVNQPDGSTSETKPDEIFKNTSGSRPAGKTIFE